MLSACGPEVSDPALRRELEVLQLGEPVTDRDEYRVAKMRILQTEAYDGVDEDERDETVEGNVLQRKAELDALLAAAGGGPGSDGWVTAFNPDGSFRGDRMRFAQLVGYVEIDVDAVWHSRERIESRHLMTNVISGVLIVLVTVVVLFFEYRNRRKAAKK